MMAGDMPPSVPKPKKRKPHLSIAVASDAARPDVRLSPRIDLDGDAVIRALSTDPNVFTQEGSLVHVAHVTEEEEEETDGRWIEGAPKIYTMKPALLRSRISRAAACVEYEKSSGEFRPVIPPASLVDEVFHRRVWPSLPPLVGVAETPFPRPDGSLVTSRGYDPDTRYLYLPSCSYGDVPEAPTQADAARALASLADVFCDFPWVNDVARYVPIAAILSIVARPAILGAVPAFLFDANTPGTGKSLTADVVCLIATGRAAPRGTFPPLPEELEKVLAGYAMSGASVIGFDDLGCGFGGAALNKVLSSPDTVDLRVLGETGQRTVRWRAVMLASANNIEVIRDTRRRCLVSRIESRLERPEERDQFKHGDADELRTYARTQRTRFVADALTILRAFTLAPEEFRPSLRFGGYDAWSRLIASSIVYAGGPSVLDARIASDAGDDGERGAFLSLLSGWSRVDVAGNGLTAREVIHLLFPTDKQVGPPDGHDPLREAIETLTRCASGRTPDARKLGEALRRYKSRNIGGREIDCRMSHGSVLRWFVRAAS